MADLPVELEAAKDRIGGAVRSVRLSIAEGQVVDAPELEIVRAIVAGGRSVPIEVSGIGECRSVGTGAGAIVLEVDGMGPGVDETELREAPGVSCQLPLDRKSVV